MAIVAKSNGTILPRSLTQYDPKSFREHMRPNFKEATAEQVLAEIKPFEVDFLPGQKFIAYDTETYYTGIPNNRMPSSVVRRWVHIGSKYYPNDFPFCMSFSDGVNSFAVYDTLENQFREFKKLEALLADPTICKIGHNLDYDLHMTANTKVNIKGRVHDTLYLSKLTRCDAFTHNLCDVADEIMCEKYPTVTIFEHMLDSYKAAHRITDYRQFPRDLMTQYTCADTWNAAWAFIALYPRMLENDQLRLYDTECKMQLVAFWMERRGVLIDPDYEGIIIPELEGEVNEAERKVYDVAGCTFNINSSQQVFDVLTKLGYGHKVKFGKPTEAMLMKGITKGNPKLDKDEFTRLENEGVPLIVDIQHYKSSLKLLNTFAVKLYEIRDSQDVVHCNINTIEAKTGRFSISMPSMQNMPRRTDSRIRDAFIAPEGYKLYDFDFKSQESIIMVHYSRSAYLMDIINTGRDIHTAVAGIIYSIPYEQVSKELRGTAKSVEFAIVYGAGPDKVANMTGLSIEEATIAMKTFLKNAPEVNDFIKTANSVAKERHMVRTILNRYVHVERGREYACVNYCCQGSAADSTKTRMVEIFEFLEGNELKTFMELQVHDSLLNCVADDDPPEILGWLNWLQTDRDLFRVPVFVDVAECDRTWRNKHDIKVPAVQPPEEMMEKMRNFNIWERGIL